MAPASRVAGLGGGRGARLPLLARARPLRLHNARLAKQLDDASTSIALNVAEATGRFGRDRKHHMRIALGSLREVDAALMVAVAKGWLAEPPMAAERDRLGGLLYGLQRE